MQMKRKRTIEVTEDIEVNMSTEENYENRSVSEEEENCSELEDEVEGNSGWADAMCRVLNAKVAKEKNFILSKAKKDTEAKVQKKDDIEIVDEKGNIVNLKDTEESVPKSHRKIRKEMIERQQQKAAWESMCRVKPDVTNKDRERELIRIATRGVVHLFNAVEKNQKKSKNADEKQKTNGNLNAKKGDFMDILKGYNKKGKEIEGDPVVKKAKQEETWSILRDDFMLGAEMKDWDKESDND